MVFSHCEDIGTENASAHSLSKLLLQHSSLKFRIYRVGAVDISLWWLTPGLAEELPGNLEERLATAAIPAARLAKGQRLEDTGRYWVNQC